MDEDLEVTRDFARVRSLVEAGCPLTLVHGKAGTGKTTLVRWIAQTFQGRIAVVAPTGVAALEAGGRTIHSFFGLPPRLIFPEDIGPAGIARLPLWERKRPRGIKLSNFV